jgi:16S rRNA (uracil1498-N3)-methyltransferase
VRLAVLERWEVNRELLIPITLGVAMPKGDRQRWLVEKATELGVAILTPLVTERTVVQPTADALRRFERAVVEASKQCGRNRLMRISPPMRWADFVAAKRTDSSVRMFALPGGAAWSSELATATRRAGEIVLAVGPEGGFTPAEIQSALDAQWKATDLGPRILRVETAALALVAMCAI